MSFNPNLQREGRFATGGYQQSGVEQGYQDAVKQDPLNQKFIRRNLKGYATLKRFAKKGGLQKLARKNYAQLERMAVKAVLQKDKIKMRRLKTKRSQVKSYGGDKLYARARKKINKGYDIREKSLGQRGLNVNQIQNKRLRKATRQTIRLRRNRRIMKTNIYAGKGYRISKGII